ncbi:hypothetical protein B0H10DRAFT_2327130 [Mycena sp. CBHHK59/15]|nr:hypothetical protein B0H10DRAFT_2327130 [Mycena sp. CBHHK59/15]
MGAVAEFVAQEAERESEAREAENKPAACEVEEELLGLPSDFPDKGHRQKLNLDAFADIEAQLREGEAFDALYSMQVVAKALVAMKDQKRKQDSGVAKNTKSQSQIVDTERHRDRHIQKYMVARTALMALGTAMGDAGDFPELKESDTYMKSRQL